jgi:hypothetical protein
LSSIGIGGEGQRGERGERGEKKLCMLGFILFNPTYIEVI